MYIFYTGIGSLPRGKHTEHEFIQVMKHIFLDPCIHLSHDFVHFTLEDWVKFSGAIIID